MLDSRDQVLEARFGVVEGFNRIPAQALDVIALRVDNQCEVWCIRVEEERERSERDSMMNRRETRESKKLRLTRLTLLNIPKLSHRSGNFSKLGFSFHHNGKIDIQGLVADSLLDQADFLLMHVTHSSLFEVVVGDCQWMMNDSLAAHGSGTTGATIDHDDLIVDGIKGVQASSGTGSTRDERIRFTVVICFRTERDAFDIAVIVVVHGIVVLVAASGKPRGRFGDTPLLSGRLVEERS